MEWKETPVEILTGNNTTPPTGGCMAEIDEALAQQYIWSELSLALRLFDAVLYMSNHFLLLVSGTGIITINVFARKDVL